VSAGCRDSGRRSTAAGACRQSHLFQAGGWHAIEAQIADIDEHCRIVSERLGEIQDQIERFSHLERLLIGPVSREFPMEHAARLAKGGASVDELTRNCGLNIGEARLIRRLHGQAEAPQLS